MFVLSAFLFGGIIGSFLNVVALRLHTGRSLNGRSHCMSCGTQLRGHELVPIVSYLIQRGRCRTCRAHITPQYVCVEVMTATLFAALAYVYQGDLFALAIYMVAAAALVVIAVYDIRHTVIPDEMVWVLVLCAALLAGRTLLTDSSGWIPVAFAAAAAAAASGAFASMWLMSRGRWIGLGDAKVIAPLGFILGPIGTFSFIVLAFWIGSLYVGIVALARVVVRRVIHKRFSIPRYTMQSEVPFGPFLIAGFFAVLIFHVDILATIQSVADAATLKMYTWFFAG